MEMVCVFSSRHRFRLFRYVFILGTGVYTLSLTQNVYMIRYLIHASQSDLDWKKAQQNPTGVGRASFVALPLPASVCFLFCHPRVFKVMIRY
jgi:hypothetical protein